MSTQAYSDLLAIVSQSHSPQRVKDAYGKVIRLNFGLKAKADGLAKDKEELKRRLYNRRNR